MTISKSKKAKCLICNNEFDVTLKTNPFCSERCSYVDLNNWLGEKYSIALNENDYDKDI